MSNSFTPSNLHKAYDDLDRERRGYSQSDNRTKRRPAGRRKLTPGIHVAVELASTWGAETAVPKSRAVLAFTHAASLLGLSSQSIELMNKLFSFSMERDWNGKTRPLVWPDNERLLAQVSYKLATIKRCLRQLSENGLISFKDSPNGKRYGKRNEANDIVLVSTYGIDLSPVGIRVAELETLADRDEAIRQEIRQLSRRWTCSKCKLECILDAAEDFHLQGPWHDCSVELDRLIEIRRGRCSVERLRDICDAILHVLERASTAYSAAIDGSHGSDGNSHHLTNDELNPKEVNSEPHIQNTKQNLDHSLYNNRRSASAKQHQIFEAGSASSQKAQKKPVAAGANVQPLQHDPAFDNTDLNLVLEACPEFSNWGIRQIRDWRDLIDRAGQMRPMMGISPDAWSQARAELGDHMSGVAIAIIYQKYSANEVREPGGYLRRMTERHREGQLRLDLTLWSLKQTAAPQNSGISGHSKQDHARRQPMAFAARLI